MEAAHAFTVVSSISAILKGTLLMCSRFITVLKKGLWLIQSISIICNVMERDQYMSFWKF